MRILDEEDIITRDIFMRPLLPEGENANIKTGMAGEPINRFMWVPATHRLGKVWEGLTVGDFLVGQWADVYVSSTKEWVNRPMFEFAEGVEKFSIDPDAGKPVLGW